MSPITIAWSMCASASAMLGLLHLLIWFKDRRNTAFLLSAIMALGASVSAITELGLLRAESLDFFKTFIIWENVAVFLLLVPMVWFIQVHFRTARRWLAVMITVLWCLGMIVNFVSPASLTFASITELKPMMTFWGEPFVVPVGVPNPWKALADAASFLVLVYVVDASLRLWRSGGQRRALIVGGSIVFFILTAGIHAPLVDAGVVATPYMISFSFLAIVMALSYELVSDVVRVSQYSREIAANERRWRSLLENVQLAVIGVDPQQRINYVNPFICELLAYTPEQLLGRSVRELIPVTDLDELDRRWPQTAEHGPRPQTRWALLCATGEQRELTWSPVRLLTADGAFAGLLSIGVDITDRLHAERDLRATQRDLERLTRVNTLGELASALAHELNQPLAAILSNAQAARRFLDAGTADLEELREILDDIVRDDKRAGAVIHRLRAMLRSGEAARELFSIGEAIQEVIDLLNSEFIAQNVTVNLHGVDDRLRVEAGRVEIQQVIMNLLMNAVRAMSQTLPENRWIDIRMYAQDAGVRVDVQDNGTGIPPGELEKIFEAFVTTGSSGLGMGLAISRRLVEAHGGHIRAENRPDGGACFSFVLPRAVAEQGYGDS